MYAYGPDDCDDCDGHDIDMEMVIGPDDCDVDGPIWDYPDPEDEDHPDGGYSTVDAFAEAMTA